MITKERLEELIKESATVYSLDRQVKYPIPIFLKDGENVVVNDNELVNSVRVIDKIENLYETQKQAEWALKYHATRTEELDLPMWEDVKNFRENEIITFYAKDIKYGMISVNVFENAFSVDSESRGELLYMNFTEENYIKACDLCMKLFKGEKNEKN